MEKKEARLDYIFKCYKRGLPVTKEELKELYDNKYDVEYDEYEVRKVISDKPKRTLGRGVNGYNISLKRDYTVYGEEEIERHDISESEIVLADSVDYENDIPEIVYEDEIGGEELIYHGFNQISKKEWMPESVIYHTKEFYAWIDSINKDFTKRIYYEPFSKYVQQSSDWMAMGYSILDHTGQDEIEFVVEEMERCSTNTLYFANKYGFLQEASEHSGRLKYLADENYVHHQILFFLIDCGYSFMLGKPRQIGSTSALGIAGICKTICKPNHYLKFITEDKDTGLEIFRDKIMFPFSQLPEFMKPEVLNDRENLFSINQSPRPKGKGKTTKRGAMSKVQIVAPTKTAINGGSPQMVFIDEIGSIPILSEMMNEGRPTMFIKSRVTGLLEQRRQLIAWGCVCAGTKVWTNSGAYVNIEDLKQDDGIIGYDGKGAATNKITWMQPPSEKPCYKIKTSERYLECSEDHPILWSQPMLSKNKKKNNKYTHAEKQVFFKEAKDIKSGDQVAIIESIPFWGDRKMKEPRFIGWMIGDGNYGTTEKTPRRQPRFYNCDEEINNYFDNHFDTTVFNQYTTKSGKEYKERNIRGVTQLLRDVGIYGQSKDKKRLPENIYNYCKDDVCEVIGGLFDTDGCVHNPERKCLIDIESSSKLLLDDLKIILHKIGIHSRIYRVKARISENRKDKNDYYRLSISDKTSLIAFAENIKLTVKSKQDRLEKTREVVFSRGNKLKSSSNSVRGVKYEKVLSVEYIGYKPIYNLTAGDNNTYIANGIITHNTGTTYEKEWTRIVTLWEQREPSVGIVPVFFDWHTRCDEKFYLEQKRYYYGGRAKSEAMDIETSRIQFHQHYPSSPSDMFIPTGKTLISRESIDSNLNRIRENMDKYGYEMQYGFFEPIFDRNKPTNSDSEFPFKITGAHFIQTDAFDDRVTTEIFIPPDASWKYRFYAGTDPISTDTGASRMATVVWDEQNHTIAAITDCKISNNPNYSFLQSMLLTIYYGTDGKAIPEIVERNISLSYRNYRENLGYLDSLVLNAEIDAYFQSGVPYDVGIDNRSKRTSHIISTLGTVVDTYGNRFYHSVVFRQLSTFHCSITRGGNETWSSIDKRYYNDDVLFGLVYAYICAMSVGRKPVNQEDGVERKISTKYKIKLDANYNLIRVPITQIEYGKRG